MKPTKFQIKLQHTYLNCRHLSNNFHIIHGQPCSLYNGIKNSNNTLPYHVPHYNIPPPHQLPFTFHLIPYHPPPPLHHVPRHFPHITPFHLPFASLIPASDTQYLAADGRKGGNYRTNKTCLTTTLVARLREQKNKCAFPLNTMFERYANNILSQVILPVQDQSSTRCIFARLPDATHSVQ